MVKFYIKPEDIEALLPRLMPAKEEKPIYLPPGAAYRVSYTATGFVPEMTLEKIEHIPPFVAGIRFGSFGARTRAGSLRLK